MFLNNKYTKIYYRIVNRSLISNRMKNDSNYYESHHIIPKCLGGSNRKFNRVLLTAREHFICHKLLCKMVILPNDIRLMVAAMSYFMNNTNRKLSSRYIEESRVYKIKFHKGKIPWNKGIPHTEETKRKIGLKNSRCTLTDDGRRRKSEFMKNNNPMDNKDIVCKIVDKISKMYSVIDPEGNIYTIKNLTKFCKDNNLNVGNMCSVSKGNLTHYKGWTCTEIKEN